MKLHAFLSVIAVAGLCAFSFAQRPAPGGQRQGRGGQPRMTSDTNGGLLGLPAVQKELHLSPQQISQITTALPQRGGGGPGGPGRGPRSSGPGGPQGGDFRAMVQQRQAAMQKAIGFLNAGQKSRLKQLTLQMYGAAALQLPSVRQSLSLTPAQTSKLDSENAKVGAERQQAFQQLGTMRPGQGNPADAKKRMDAFRKLQDKFRGEQSAAVDKILTGPQKGKWHAMLGKPFDVSQLRRQRGGGGGGRGGRGGGGARLGA